MIVDVHRGAAARWAEGAALQAAAPLAAAAACRLPPAAARSSPPASRSLAACYIAIDNHVDVRTPLQKIGLLSSAPQLMGAVGITRLERVPASSPPPRARLPVS